MLRLLNFQNVFTAFFTLLFMALMIHMGFLQHFCNFKVLETLLWSPCYTLCDILLNFFVCLFRLTYTLRFVDKDSHQRHNIITL